MTVYKAIKGDILAKKIKIKNKKFMLISDIPIKSKLVIYFFDFLFLHSKLCEEMHFLLSLGSKSTAVSGNAFRNVFSLPMLNKFVLCNSD